MKNNAFIRLSILGIATLLLTQCATQTIVPFEQGENPATNPLNVFPTPKSVILGNGKIKMPSKLNIVYTSATTPNTLGKEGYKISITPKKISVESNSDIGKFYAQQTLSQITTELDGTPKKFLPICEITDSPDIVARGVVEGFYARPEPGWNHQGRIDLLKFMGRAKLNTYIYGPKDDKYHGFSGKTWREPYPPTEAEKMKELVKVAKENKVNLVWTAHTGGDGDWRVDHFIIAKASVKKFEAMYDLGIRSFGFFLDDVGNTGGDKQAEVLNYINKHFVKVKKDVSPLVMCPTEYNKGWSNKTPGSYLDILGEKLDSDINIMWTGNSVCSDITEESLHWINNRIKRPAYIWWNWPVQDYCRTNLPMGRSYGCQTVDPSLYSGFTSNPMNKSYASQIPLFSMADYTWNMAGAESDRAWRAGIQRLYPSCHEAVQTFCNHNSDQGPNGHGYRREESVAFAPIIEKATETIKKNQKITPEIAAALNHEFDAMTLAGNTMLTDPACANLRTEIQPWIQAFEKLGVAGNAALRAYQNKDDVRALGYFAHTISAYKSYENISKHANQNGWQNGVKPASRVVAPFIQNLCNKISERTYLAQTGEELKPTTSNAMQFKAFSNVENLKNLKASRQNKKFVELNRILEIITLKPNDYIGLELPVGVVGTYVHVKLNNPNAPKQGIIEVSTNGKTWKKCNTSNNGEEMKAGLNPKEEIRFFRYINTSSSPIEIKTKLFKFDIPANAFPNSLDAISDCDFTTAYTIEADTKQIVTVPFTPNTHKDHTLVLIEGDVAIENATLIQGDVITAIVPKNVNTLKITSNKKQTIKIYEAF